VTAPRERVRRSALVPARHGVAAPRGQDVPGGRFGRMFPFLPRRDLAVDAMRQLARGLEALELPPSENTDVPAGYTYLGQFIDHDITFEPMSMLGRDNDPRALVNFRTPRFDLDSVYGAGPAAQPFLYDWRRGHHPGVKLLVDRRCDGDAPVVDLPRNSQGRALIGDARNDEHLIISQLHLLFVRFHNRVVDHLCHDGVPRSELELFDEAQRLVRWHYQWIVIHDFLPAVVADEIVARAIGGVATRLWSCRDAPAIPVEFSAAAFRFGHSMVRDKYLVDPGLPAVPIFAAPDQDDGHHLGGLRPLPAEMKIAWELFFFHPDTSAPHNASFRIDRHLSEPLRHLAPDDASLADLNLRRGRALGLPSGTDVARAMDVVPLTDDELKLPPLGDAMLTRAAWAAVLRAPPLWFYILSEAYAKGGHGLRLGPVGGTIVAETLVGLLDADPQSYLRQWPGWTPDLPRADPAAKAGDFTMIDLVAFTGDADDDEVDVDGPR
jgi:hypothetical protein